ncbi:MAG: hypothetical protein DBX59_00125 [Bacillota bacterium]|nr:MAG: hypothetical protein DBX59_00125 [Bacillota bacterium]
MKKAISLTLVSALTFSLLAGCSRPGAAGTGGSNDSGSGSAEYVLRIGHTVQGNSPTGKLYEEIFEPYIEEHSNGRIDVQVYSDSTLGNDASLTEALQLGTIEMASVPTSALANFCADFVALDLPFVFDDKETVYAALDGEFGDYFFKELEDINIKGVSWSENGFRNISSNKAVRTLEDMKGQKIRVMESQVYLSTMKAFGANPTPMAFNELYTGLSQGTVDGQDNGIILTYTAKLYEVQDYYTICNYVYAPACNLASLEWWNSLPEDLQQVVQEGADLLTDAIREKNAEMEEEYLKLIEESGTEVIYLDEAERDRFREACSGVYEEMRSYVNNPEVIDMALSVAEEYGQ